MSNPNEMTDTVGTNPDLFSIHAEVPANKDRALNPSYPLSYCSKAVCFVQLCDDVTDNEMDQNTLLTQSEMTDTIGTSRDLFCIHAEVLASNEEACDPSSS